MLEILQGLSAVAGFNLVFLEQLPENPCFEVSEPRCGICTRDAQKPSCDQHSLPSLTERVLLDRVRVQLVTLPHELKMPRPASHGLALAAARAALAVAGHALLEKEAHTIVGHDTLRCCTVIFTSGTTKN